MPYYSDEIIEQVCAANSIEDVIGSYVKLKRSGGNLFGLCPFHSEKSPSFSVSPSKQMYHCFGCGEGGNVISFVKRYENYTFPEAVKYLAERAGIALPEVSLSAEEKAYKSVKTQLLAIQKDAAGFYYKMLRSEYGKSGLEYLTNRSLSKETMQSFGLGFASRSGGLYQYLKQKGYTDDLLKEAGLFYYDERRGPSDKFWDRVMFPIMDVNNRVIGFGGRVMGTGEPKYLNSPETKIFDKGRNLYALNKARLNHGKSLILCEGYMDVISMHQAGFSQAVASLGTAFTSGHASLLKRYTKDVILSYDSDGAGIKAALRAIPILKAEDINARILNLSPYKDPDEFIKAKGAEEFKKRLDCAENSFYFELRVNEDNFNISDPGDKTRFLDEAAKKLSEISSELERENYIEAVASKYIVDPNVLRRSVAKFAGQKDGIREVIRPKSTQKNEGVDGNIMAQRLLLTWLCEEPGIFKQVKEYIKDTDFTEGINRIVAEKLYKQLSEGNVNPALIVNNFEDEEDHKAVSLIFNTELPNANDPSVREKAITDLVVKIKTNAVKNEIESDNGSDPLARAVANRKALDEIKKIKITL